MNPFPRIARHLLEVHEGGNWTEVSLADALGDVSAAEAASRTPASPNTIEMLVNHLIFWNRHVCQGVEGLAAEEPPHNGFLSNPQLDARHWQSLREDLFASARELAAAVEAVPEERADETMLPAGGSVYKNLQGAVEHLHYHLGQIVLLKKFVRAMSQAPH